MSAPLVSAVLRWCSPTGRIDPRSLDRALAWARAEQDRHQHGTDEEEAWYRIQQVLAACRVAYIDGWWDGYKVGRDQTAKVMLDTRREIREMRGQQ